MRYFKLNIIVLCCYWIGLVSPTTLTGGFLLQPPEEYPFTRVGVNTFFGINVIYASQNSLLLATNQDLFRSSDNGETWAAIAEPLTYRNITAILPHGDTVYAGTSHGAIHRTTDHGLTWKQHSQPVNSGPITTIFNINGQIVASSDELIASAPHNGPYAASLLDSTLILQHTSGAQAHIQCTAFAGATAVEIHGSTIFIAVKRAGILTLEIENPTISHVKMEYLEGAFITTLVLQDGYLYAGLKLGQGGVHRKPLAGTSWEPVINDRIAGIVEVTALVANERGVYVASREHGVSFIGRSTQLMRSISDGLHHAIIQTISEVDSMLIVGCRLRGVLRLTKQGRDLAILSDDIPHSPEYMVGTVGRTIVVGFADGKIIQSNNNGKTWDSLPSPFARATLNTIVGHGNVLYATTTSGVWHSSDLGGTWKSLHVNLERENIQKVVVHDSVTIIMTTAKTFLLRPNGELENFDPKIPEEEHPPKIIDAVVYGHKIYGTGYPGFYVSDDFGRTWKSHTISKTMILRTLAITKGFIYVATDMGKILSCPLP